MILSASYLLQLSLGEPLFPHIDRELDSVPADTESVQSSGSGADGGWARSSRKKCKWGWVVT